MSCLPPSAKCEWRDLKYFVAHWNAQRHSAFERTACLDLCSQTKQPEVLCTDTQTGSKLVIERKSLLWPQNYAEIHHAEHRFWEFLTTAINRLLISKLSQEGLQCMLYLCTVTVFKPCGVSLLIRSRFIAFFDASPLSI